MYQSCSCDASPITVVDARGQVIMVSGRPARCAVHEPYTREEVEAMTVSSGI